MANEAHYVRVNDDVANIKIYIFVFFKIPCQHLNK